MVISTPTMSSMPTLPPQSSMTSTSGPPISATASIPAIPGTSSDRLGVGIDATSAAARDVHLIQPFCRVCQRKFTTPETFQYHCEMHRQGFHWCEFCNKLYRDSSVFRRHLTMHDPHRKLYVCHMCRRVFSWKNNLTQHLRTVHHVNIPRQRWSMQAKKREEEKLAAAKQ